MMNIIIIIMITMNIINQNNSVSLCNILYSFKHAIERIPLCMTYSLQRRIIERNATSHVKQIPMERHENDNMFVFTSYSVLFARERSKRRNILFATAFTLYHQLCALLVVVQKGEKHVT